MKKLSTSICLGLGDNIVARVIFDSVKHDYSEIRISHNKSILDQYKRGDTGYMNFLTQIGNLLFTERPFVFDAWKPHQPIHTYNTFNNLYIPGRSNLQHLFCHGTPLNVDEEYIVITTKIRGITKQKFMPLSIELWKVLKKLSERYKIVVLGERTVQPSVEYKIISNIIIGIYEQIIANLPVNRVIDLTIPALGITPPDLNKIKQDALIMQNAKFVITLGIGGNVSLAAVTANKVIGFRSSEDGDQSADILFGPAFTSVQITKDWGDFIKKIEVA